MEVRERGLPDLLDVPLVLLRAGRIYVAFLGVVLRKAEFVFHVSMRVRGIMNRGFRCVPIHEFFPSSGQDVHHSYPSSYRWRRREGTRGLPSVGRPRCYGGGRDRRRGKGGRPHADRRQVDRQQ